MALRNKNEMESTYKQLFFTLSEACSNLLENCLMLTVWYEQQKEKFYGACNLIGSK